MKVTCEYRGQRTIFDFADEEIVIGRAGPRDVRLKLDFDSRVSRRHARIWWEVDQFVVSDLGSSAGTLVNGTKITGKRALVDNDRVQLGETVLKVQSSDGASMLNRSTPEVDESAFQNEKLQAEQGEIEISGRRDSIMPSTIQLPGATGEMQDRLQLLYDLPLELAHSLSDDSLFGRILNGVVRIIPGAERGALLVLDRLSTKLELRASIPEDSPPISRTLVRRAAAEGQGFIWSRSENTDPSMSITSIGMQTGMYCPLMWQGDVLGVICVDNPRRRQAFSVQDLDFLIAVAHYAAAAVSNRILQNDLQHYIETQRCLLTNFSPSLRDKIVDQARTGNLKAGGEKSNVTLLMSDLRAFTRISADMSTDEVVAMLNEYFSALTEAIFRNRGTIDKFIGDAILAVFGSPEHDEEQDVNAVKAAMDMQLAMEQVNKSRQARGEKTCGCGIGLHRGEVLHGFIGAEERLEFTVIGDAVNKTSRICDGAKADEILISPVLHAEVKETFEFSETEIMTKHEGSLDVWRLKPTVDEHDTTIEKKPLATPETDG